MIEWKKENGTVIKTNEEEASIRAAIDAGWEQVKLEEKAPEQKAPKAPRKQKKLETTE